jgi:gliding motility-associated-like protein
MNQQKNLCFISLLIILAFLTHTTYGQGENNNWRFGSGLGLNFNLGTPVLVTSNIRSQEGCATASDAAGNLLFYSNGNNVWDATGAVMPNGSGILGNGMGYYGTGSASQGVAIVKSISNPDRYYLFVLDSDTEIALSDTGYLRYSIIDMTLNGGLGDIIPGQKNIILDSFMAETMVVTKGTACNYWLITHRNNSAAYRVFKIDAGGLDPVPVTSSGVHNGFIIGEVKISHDGKTLALVSSASENIEIAAFDPNTGMVSVPQVLGPPVAGRYGTEFSPDNSRLYVGEGPRLVQYDLSAYPNMTTIQSTRTVIEPAAQSAMVFRMRLGPDNKIYLAKMAFLPGIPPSIACINLPNALGSSCNYDSAAIPVLMAQTFPIFATTTPSGMYGFGFDNKLVIVSGPEQTITSPRKDTVICSGSEITLSGRQGCTNFLWSNGSTDPALSIRDEGTYWVSSKLNCTTYLDTFHVTFAYLRTLGPDTFICKGSSMLLDVTTAGASYLWQDGSTNATFTVTGKGRYSVTITKGNCRLSDTIQVDETEPYLKIAGNDSITCEGGVIKLSAEARPASAYLWSTGSTEDTITVRQAGTYSVTASNACGTFSTAIRIAIEDCSCPVFIPNAFTPNGDGKNDLLDLNVYCQVSAYRLTIFNRFGEMVFASDDIDKRWDGTYKGKPADVGTYFFDLKYTGERSAVKVERKGDLTLLR